MLEKSYQRCCFQSWTQWKYCFPRFHSQVTYMGRKRMGKCRPWSPSPLFQLDYSLIQSDEMSPLMALVSLHGAAAGNDIYFVSRNHFPVKATPRAEERLGYMYAFLDRSLQKLNGSHRIFALASWPDNLVNDGECICSILCDLQHQLMLKWFYINLIKWINKMIKTCSMVIEVIAIKKNYFNPIDD